MSPKPPQHRDRRSASPNDSCGAAQKAVNFNRLAFMRPRFLVLSHVWGMTELSSLFSVWRPRMELRIGAAAADGLGPGKTERLMKAGIALLAIVAGACCARADEMDRDGGPTGAPVARSERVALTPAPAAPATPHAAKPRKTRSQRARPARPPRRELLTGN